MEKYIIEELPGHVFIAHREFQGQLLEELAESVEIHDRLIINTESDPTKSSVWAQDTWHDPIKIIFPSITQGVKALRSLGKNWVNFPVAKFRRAALIQEQLSKFKVERITFPQPVNYGNFGCWALIDDNTIIASTKPEKNVPLGEYEFVENKTVPPNRAYLKLWELFTTLDMYPKRNERCLDLGSSPGGWTWVLQGLGARVISVDKAELDPKIAKLPGVEFLQESAFSLDPKQVGKVDWLFSDVICYPERLYDLVCKWMDSGVCKNFVCTVKLQGEMDFDVIEKFRQIPGSCLLHLYHNKHEITFVRY